LKRLIFTAVWFVCAAVLFIFLKSRAVPSGNDGYFYLVQIRSLAEHHSFYYPDHSFAFILPYIFSFVSSNILLLYQLCVAVIWSALVTIPAFACMQLMEKNDLKNIPIFTAAVFILLSTSAPLLLLGLGFYKNIFGLTFFLTGLFLFNAKGKKRIAGCVLILLSLFSHKSMFLLLFIFGISYAVNCAPTKRLRSIVIPSLAAILCATLCFIFLFRKGFEYLSNLKAFASTPKGWFSWFIYISSHNHFLFLYAVMAIFSVALYIFLRRKYSSHLRFIFDGTTMFLLISLFPFQQIDFISPGYRMLLIIPVFLLPFTVYLINSEIKKRPVALGILMLLCSVHLFLFVRNIPLVTNSFPDEHFSSTDIARLNRFVSGNDIIIAHHDMKYYITWTTGFKTTEYVPEHASGGIFRVAYIPNYMFSEKEHKTLDVLCLSRLGNEYGLFRETDWKTTVKRLAIISHWKNPDTVKPDYIY
jgi:hypothetical protein